MPRDLKVALTIEANDRASGTVRRLTQEAEQVGKRTRRITEDADRVAERSAQRNQNTQARAARAREQLETRSGSRMRRELQQTEAAYNRLARTGRTSATEQARAYGQMQQRVSGLRREMSGLAQQENRLGRGRGAGSLALRAGSYLVAGGAAAGVRLAAASVSPPVRRTMDYESRLAMMSNTAFAERDVPGRLAGMRTLKEAIDNAVRVGGGSRDDAANALDSLLSSGAMSHKSAVNLLPMLQKASVATGANPEELAQIAIRGMQTFGIAEADIPKALDMAVKAGQGGGFELKDMARWLPKIMAMGKQAGMSGLQDFGALVGVAQSSLITGGTTDAAGNNLANLLAKINSRDTAMQAKKIEIAPGKSIDLAGTLKKKAGEGMNSIDAFVGIVDKVVAKNHEFQALRAQLNNPALADGDRRAIMEKQSAILQGSAVGQLIQDQQALLALVGYMGNRKYVKDIMGTYGNGIDAIALNHEVIGATGNFKVDALSNERQIAEFEAFKGLAGVVGNASKGLAELAKEYPGLTASVIGATEALKVLALVAGSAMAVSLWRGRAGVAGAAGGALVGSAAAGRGAGMLGTVAKRAGIAGAIGLGGVAAYGIMSDPGLTEEQKKAALTQAAFGMGGGLSGAYAGAIAGTALMPVFGTAAGALLGGVAGGYLGDSLGERISAAFTSTDTPAPAAPRGYLPLNTLNGPDGPLKQEDLTSALIQAKGVPQAIDLNVTVDVQNGNITAAVNEINERAARRN